MNDYIYTLEIEVRDYELDSEGIVNNANYLHYLEHTRHAFCKQEGVSFGSMTSGGLVPVVNHMSIDYRRPLRSGDVMLSRLWVERRGVRFFFHQDIYDKTSGELSVSAEVSIVCLENGKLSRADELAAKFAKYLDK